MKLNLMKRPAALILTAAFLFLSAQPSGAAAPAAIPYHRVSPNGTVCLTVDDGYGWQNQKRILDTLKRYNVKCTFFIVGEALLRTPNLWKQAILDGHEICYHSMRHKNLTSMTTAQIQQDINQWNAALARALPGYKSPRLARFPGGNGAKNARVMNVFARNGYTVIGWSVQNISVRTMVSHMKSAVRSNSIILIHFDPVNCNALPKYIGWLKSHFRLGRVSDAFPASKPTPTPTPTPKPTPAPTPMPKPSYKPPLPPKPPHKSAVTPAPMPTPTPEPAIEVTIEPTIAPTVAPTVGAAAEPTETY